MNATECACRQAERDNLVKELADALDTAVLWIEVADGPFKKQKRQAVIDHARAVLAKARSNNENV